MPAVLDKSPVLFFLFGRQMCQQPSLEQFPRVLWLSSCPGIGIYHQPSGGDSFYTLNTSFNCPINIFPIDTEFRNITFSH